MWYPRVTRSAVERRSKDWAMDNGGAPHHHIRSAYSVNHAMVSFLLVGRIG